jgi:hypothetical protein
MSPLPNLSTSILLLLLDILTTIVHVRHFADTSHPALHNRTVTL